jgi:IS5 family transposase
MVGLFDLEYHERKIKEYQPPLSKLDKVINWYIFKETLDKGLTTNKDKAVGGRPPFDKLMMFKILILQRYYNLSDQQTEFQINDRTSFKQFLNLKLGDTIPDEKTIWHFKEQLKIKGLSLKLFTLFTNRLVSHGIVAKEGTMIDASFVKVPIQRNTRKQNKQIKDGEIPQEFCANPNKLSQKDCDARWVVKGGQRVYGYKDHISADQKTKLITKYHVTSASTHDSQVLKMIIDQDDKTIYADSAYKSVEIDEYLKEKNIKAKIIHRAYRNRPLKNFQHKKNYKHSKTRVRVEHIFGTLTSQMNKALDLTQIGLDRVKSSIGLANLTYNLVRYEQLVRLQRVKVV